MRRVADNSLGAKETCIVLFKRIFSLTDDVNPYEFQTSEMNNVSDSDVYGLKRNHFIRFSL